MSKKRNGKRFKRSRKKTIREQELEEVIDFEIELCNEAITPHGGLAPAGRFLDTIGLRKMIDRYLPKPGSNRGFPTWKYIYLLCLMFLGGGRHIEDIREVTSDRGLMKVLNMKNVPSYSTLGDWLRRLGTEGSNGLKDVNKDLFKLLTRKSNIKTKDLTLWLDTTVIESGKYGAAMTYKGYPGYNPHIGVIQEFKYILNYKFRDGNKSPSGGVNDFFKDTESYLPEGYRIGKLIADSAYYNSEIFNHCFDKDIKFCITADKDAAVLGAISTINNWRPYIEKNGNETNREIGETIHTMTKTNKSFRLIVLRKLRDQLSLFNEGVYSYHIVATNLDDPAEEVIYKHNKTGEMEKCLDELKNGFNASYIPTDDFGANDFYFAISILAYNIFILIKYLILPLSWRNKTIATFRWALIELGAKVTFHGRRLFMKIAATVEKFKTYIYIFDRLKQLCRADL